MLIDKRTIKIISFISLIGISFLFFFLVVSYWVLSNRNLPNTKAQKTYMSKRGNIISSDGYKIATSKKLYKAIIDKRNLDPDKKDLFIKLYSIYSSMSIKDIKTKISKAKHNQVVLSYSIDFKQSRHMKELAQKLYRLGVFQFYHDVKHNSTFLHGLSIVQSGEKRLYPYGNMLTPLVGYIKKYESKYNLTRVRGIKGIEKSQDDYLNSTQNGRIVGQKDILRTIILDKTIKKTDMIDGNNINITINLKLQKDIEKILDFYKTKFETEEIIVGLIDSNTSKFVALASSNRFYPNKIKKVDYKNLNINAIEYLYEPGSVFKPFVFSLLLEHQKIKLTDIIYLEKGRFKLNKQTITDAHKLEWVSLDQVIIHSSNIGMAKLVQNLEALEIYDGIKKFGFTKKSNIELNYDKSGSMPNLFQLKNSVYKSTISYGYGIEVNLIQLLKAYNAFNNSGIMSNLSILQDSDKINMRAISAKTANTMKQILIDTVQTGTGQKAKTIGLEIGGKTGTAHMVEKGKYKNMYNSSFIGFINDSKGQKYVLGVLIKKIPKNIYHFASQSAVVVFKSIVDLMVERSFLLPSVIEKSKIKNKLLSK